MPIANLFEKLGHRLLAASRKYDSAPFPDTISIGSRIIHDLKPLGGFRTPGLTKAGRLSFRGICNGKVVKVYSAFSTGQIALRRAVQAVAFEGCEFPDIIAADEHLVVEPWIQGIPVAALSGKALDEARAAIASFLASFQAAKSVTLADSHRGSFDYLDDYLIQRLGAWVHLDSISAFLESWREHYSELASRIPERLSHPDLSAANVIRENDSGRLLVIDNELLGVGCGWILDGRNSLVGSDEAVALADHGIPASFVEKTWTLRRLGSALDAARIRDVPRILHETT